MKEARRHRTRNQRKRDMIRSFCMGFVCVLLWLMLCTVIVRAWGHPAEQPISYAEHMEAIGGDSYGNPQD